MVVDRTTEAPDLAASHGSDLRDAGSRLKEEGQALSSSLVDAGKDAAAEARDLGEKAMSSLGSETEAVRDEAAEGLIAFSDALKAASAELSGKRLGFAGDMVEQAAGGLEALARSFEGRSPGEMLETVRSFGRQNPVGFIAGSVLAGFALGRVAAAAAPAGSGTPDPQAPAAVDRAPKAGVGTPAGTASGGAGGGGQDR